MIKVSEIDCVHDLHDQLDEIFIIKQQNNSKHLLDSEKHIQINQNTQITITKQIKKKIIVCFIILFICYRLFYHSTLRSEQYIYDLTHQLTSYLNQQINKAEDFSYYFIVTGQVIIDFQIIMFIVFQIFKMKNFYLCTFIGVYYAVRGIFLNIQKFPYPQGIYWTDPQFPPTIGVPYGITRDFFYSGHTGLMLFSLIYWQKKQSMKQLKYISIVGLPLVILLIISTRVHYCIDIIAAICFTFWIQKFIRQKLSYFDWGFTILYEIGIKIILKIKKILN